jgi:amino acid transporter
LNPVSGVRLKGKVPLGGALFLLVGNVVGASIFILPGQLTEIVGPAVYLAYLLAAVPAVCYALIAAQISCIMPVSAADYVFSSIALHPSIGFIKVWATILTAMVAVRDNLVPAACYFGLVGLGGVYYVLRKRYLDGIGISLDGLLKWETEEAAKATYLTAAG